VNAPWLTIIGMGDNGFASLTPEAMMALDGVRCVFAPERLATTLDLAGKEVHAWTTPFEASLAKVIARRGKPTAILATGDPMHYGIGATLAGRFDAAEMRVLASPSAFALAAARMGWPLQNTACLSLHGRAIEALHPHVLPGNRILVLTSDGASVGSIAALLAQRGYGRSQVTVLEHMGGAKERRVSFAADDKGQGPFADFNTLAIDCVADTGAALLPPVPGLPDDAFAHDGQITKREVRAATLAALAPFPGALLWDIGAGCGSVAVEWMRAAHDARAIAIEPKVERVALIRHNAAALGTPSLTVVESEAPAALARLDAPDAVFIGGGLTDNGVFDAAWAALKPGGILVANAVTLESEALLIGLHAARGGALTRIAIARADAIGPFHGWRPLMPVTQWAVRKGAAS
jgi:precorrin-6Y C5,15-methyltransferase (decarboxylating)